MTNENDLSGIQCRNCHEGNYKETSITDDWDGLLHCDHCGYGVNRREEVDPSEKYRNPNDKPDRIFKKVDTWIWYQMGGDGYHRLLILNPTTGDMIGAWALYDDLCFNGPFMAFTDFWEDVVPTETLLSFRVAGTMSHKK